MNDKAASVETGFLAWRAHCQRHRERFRTLGALSREAIELAEVSLIERVCRADLPLAERARAFRGIVELRGCTAREVATFFDVEPAIVVCGISLLELPQEIAAAKAA